MKLRWSGLLPVVALALAGCVGPVRNPHVPQPVRAVVTSQYVGRWYEVARYPQPFENGCEGVTADYARRTDGVFTVVNTCRRGSPTGPIRSVAGTARLVRDSGGAKMRVTFLHGLVTGNYWVLNHDDSYSWAVVGEPTGRFLWLLARQPMTGDQRQALLRQAAELGYPTAPLHLTVQAAGG